MAVDTASKRFSMMQMGNPVPMNLPPPDGTIGSPDMLHLMRLYSGIAASPPAGTGTYPSAALMLLLELKV